MYKGIKRNIKRFSIVLMTTWVVSFVHIARAAETIDSIETLFTQIYGILYPVGIFTGIAFIGLAGYRMMISEGDPRKLDDAKDQLLNAVVGVAFIIFGIVIIRIIVKSAFGDVAIN